MSETITNHDPGIRGDMNVLAIKMTALAAAVGGPLFVFDQLTVHLSKIAAFAFAFSPVLVVAFAALFLSDESTPNTRRLLAIGIGAGGVLLAMNAFAAVLLPGHDHPDEGLIWFGIAVGSAGAFRFIRRARAYLRA